MSKLKNMLNTTHGRLTVVARDIDNNDRKARWICNCLCGNTTTVIGSKLRNGSTKSCGCFARDNPSNLLHGCSKTKIYNTWYRMKYRCYNPKYVRYDRYGGRGIKICKRWHKFGNFLEDMGHTPTQKHSIDRVDNNKDYCPENCVWATSTEQTRNTSGNRNITFNSRTQCVAAWSDEIGIKAKIIYRRLDDGWLIDQALNTPVGGRKND